MFESFISHVYGDGLLADNVDTTLSVIAVQQNGAVISEVQDQ